MYQNIKVDIIYYKTNTDFEMEFNLSGCCRMRLLTNKTTDKKIFVNQLARAVSRSRIIIVTGNLFESDNIIKTVSAAIGRKCCVAENKKFGISGNDEIMIVENSIPLVSSDGIFGGCIIEQGPQTLILLTENKSVRKNVMQNLIHPYIQEVCAADLIDMVAPSTVSEEAQEEKGTQDKGADESTESGNSEGSDINLEPEHSSTTSEISDTDFQTDVSDNPDEQELANEDLTEIASETASADEAGDTQDSNEAMAKSENEAKAAEAEEERISFGNDPEETIKFSQENQESDVVFDDDEPEYIGDKLNIPIIILAVILMIIALIMVYCIFIVPQSSGVTSGQYIKEAFGALFS